MKRLLVLILISCSCADNSPHVKHRKFKLQVQNGEGFNLSFSRIDCDSFEMITSKSAYFWSDGQKGNIICNSVIMPSSLTELK